MKKKKHIIVLSILASIVLVVGGICAWVGIRSMRANDILKEVQWYDPEGKEFTISTKDELLDVSNLSKYFDFKGQTIYLGKDIEVNTGDAEKWSKELPELVWSPIVGFAGTFDGKGHTISGIYAYGVNSSVGLFTETNATCTIKNLRLENSYILGLNDDGTGSIIGCGSGALDTVYSNAIVEGQADNVGGLIGYIRAGKTNLVQNCWFDGEVKATEGTSSYVGGLVGKVLSNTSLCKIMDCLNTADVSANGEYVGGFIGAIVGETNMWLTDCLSTGDVKGAEGAKTVAMAVGAVFKQVSLTTRTCWVQEGSYAGRFGNAAGEIKGILASVPKEQLQGFDAYTYTTLEFDRAWAVQEEDIPMLKCFAKNDPDLSGVVKLLDVSWYDEKSAELHIKNLAQLNGFNFLSQVYNYSGQKVVLDNDITINEGKAKDWAKNAPEYEWTPVGRYVDEEGKTKGQTFAGTFDGNGHTISGMYINVDSTKAFAVGFFGKVIGKIQNLSLVNSYIGGTAGGNVGTFAASFAGGIAENLYSNAIIDIDANHVGGIVGRDESEATFINCWFDGAVKGKERVGGIMGSMNNNTTLTIQHCLNSGSVHSTSYYAGGLSGLLSNGVATVEDSLNVGKITTDKAERWCGGIAGVVNGKEGIGIKATIKNTYSLITANKLAYGLNGPERKIIGAGGILLTENELNGSNAYQFTNLNFKEYWSVVRGKSPVLKTFATGTMKASGSKLADMNWYTVDGKSFKISTAAQLRGLAILSRTNTFEGQTFELTKDIKLPQNLSWEPIGKHVDGAKNTVGQIFKGTFKGNGHTIEGLNIELGENAVAYGLFGQVAGTIRDLRLKDGKISGKAVSAIGSLAGSLVGQATISNIYSNVTLDVDANYVGGIVGKNEGKTKNVITNCWNDGHISGTQRVAGIVGYSAKNSELEMTHCLNTKEITSASEQYVAGLCGLADQCKIAISDSLNIGKISTTSDKALGYSGAILGGVNGKEDALGTASIQNVYYLASSCTKGVNVVQGASKGKYVTVTGNGAIALTEEYLTDENAYVWTDLDFKDYWTVVKKSTPVLKTMAEKVKSVSAKKLVDTSWYDVTGTTFNIDTAEKVAGLALLSRINTFSGQTFNVVKDVELPDVSWEPIGKHVDADKNTVGQIFAGTFNGNGHTISGLTMELTGNEVAYGLFGQVSGTVKELVLKDAYIDGKATSAIGTLAGDLLGGATIEKITCENVEIDVEASYVGGIAGKNSGTAMNTVKDSEFAGSISGTSAVGGIVGQAIKNSKIDIVNCENKAAVSATGANVGGICGYALEGATVSMEMCNNSGHVKAGANYAGGMLGYANKKSVIAIENCWNSGTIDGKERVAGLLGYLAEGGTVDIAHCLNSGTIKSNTTNYAAGMVGLAEKGSVTMSDTLNVGSIKPGQSIGYSGAIVGGITASQASPVTATFNDVYYMSSSSSKGANIVASAAAYITVKGTGVFDITEAELRGEEALRYTTLDFENYWTTVEESTPALRAFTAGTIAGQVSKIDVSWYDESKAEFIIYDEADLWGFVLLSETQDFAGETIKLGADITVTEGNRWQVIGKHTVNEAGDTIGETFAGIFDGSGYTISGLHANTVGNVVAIGPFGEVSGTVQNLKLTDYHITDSIVVNTTDIADNSIDSKEELWAFTLLAQYEDFADETITLNTDITLNDTTNADWYEAEGIRNWQPIGKYTDEDGLVIGMAFEGTFDGNGKKITGLAIELSGKDYAFGLFGQLKGTVQELKLEKAHISGIGKSVGSVAGVLMGGAQVNRVSSENAVIDVSGIYTGGLVGQNAGTTENIVQNSYFQGSVNQSGGSGLTGVAGIVGYANTNSVLDVLQCKVEGTVTGAALNTRAVSGIIGLGDKGSNLTITGCINGASLSGGYYTGGICGLANQNTIAITDSINTGGVTGDATHKGSLVGRFNGATCKPALSNVYYLKVDGLEAYKNNGATITGTAIPLETIKGDLDWYDVTAIEQTTAPKVTYTIDSADDLWGFALVSRISDFANKKVTLGASITMDNNSWNPIGYHENPAKIGKTFAGIFDGAGYTITGLNINLASTTENIKEYGLFGRVSGTIQNLKLEECTISGVGHGNNQKVGTVVGALYGGKLLNVQSNATINAKAHHLGGLVGCVAGSGATSLIEHCKFEGTITIQGSGNLNTGGLVGMVDTRTAQIKNCLNSANITGAKENIGGLCGQVTKGSVTISDCLTTGIVAVKGTRNATVVGAVNGNSTNKGNVTFNNVYYLNNGTQPVCTSQNATNATITDADKCYSKTEAELKSLGENDLNSDHWIFKQGQLPALKSILVTQ